MTTGINKLYDELFNDKEDNDKFLREIIGKDREVSEGYFDRIQYMLAISNLLREQKDEKNNPLYAYIGVMLFWLI